MRESWPQRVALANLPTPIQPLQRWSDDLGGPRIWIKRDDLTGMALSGNKIRKLEYVAHAALADRSDVLITCGAVQSNHARATVVVAARLGMKSHLVLRGEKPQYYSGNYLLDKIFGAESSFITPDEYTNQRQQIMHSIVADYSRKGLRAFVIPEGASDALGAFGYAHAVEEIMAQEKELGINFDAMVCAVGSGGTHAGLILGKKTAKWECSIIGINICDDAEYFAKKITGILDEVQKKYHQALDISSENIQIIDGYIGDGYGKSRPDELKTLIRLARREGVVLDPVYTGKAMHGLVQEIAKGRFKEMKNILFLHSGGLFGLLGVAETLQPLLDAPL
jgi:D-cysteine desulfhydrase